MQISHLLLFPIHYSNSYIPFPVRVVFVLTLIAISFILDLFYQTSGRNSKSSHFVIIVCDIIRKPLMILLCCFAIYSLFDLTQLYFPHTFNLHARIEISSYLSLIEMFTVVWILFRSLIYAKHYRLRTKFEK